MSFDFFMYYLRGCSNQESRKMVISAHLVSHNPFKGNTSRRMKIGIKQKLKCYNAAVTSTSRFHLESTTLGSVSSL